MAPTSAAHTFAIRRIHADDRAAFTSHLLRLDRVSRRSRYGYTICDETVRAYAEKRLVRNAIIYGYFEDGVIRGIGELHLARYGSDSLEPYESGRGGELAFSVELDWRRRGIGTALAERLLLAARNRSVAPLTLSCSPENDAMLALARKHGARLSYTGYGVKGYLPTTSPTILSRFRELAARAVHIGTGERGVVSHDGVGAFPICRARRPLLGLSATAAGRPAES